MAKRQDKTINKRSDKRKSQLQAAAERDGFKTWSSALTAWKNGKAILIKSQRNRNNNLEKEFDNGI